MVIQAGLFVRQPFSKMNEVIILRKTVFLASDDENLSFPTKIIILENVHPLQ